MCNGRILRVDFAQKIAHTRFCRLAGYFVDYRLQFEFMLLTKAQILGRETNNVDGRVTECILVIPLRFSRAVPRRLLLGDRLGGGAVRRAVLEHRVLIYLPESSGHSYLCTNENNSSASLLFEFLEFDDNDSSKRVLAKAFQQQSSSCERFSCGMENSREVIRAHLK